MEETDRRTALYPGELHYTFITELSKSYENTTQEPLRFSILGNIWRRFRQRSRGMKELLVWN